MVNDILHSLGLSENEISLYLALLPLGSSTATALANRVKLSRSTAQYTCQQLVKKGFINVIHKNNTYFYSPEPPEKLFMFLEMQKKDIDSKESQLNEVIGDLKAMINPDAVIPKVKFYQGINGLIEMFEDVIKENSTLYGALQLNSDTHPAIIDYAFNDYAPRRMKSGNKAFMLFNDSPITREYKKNDKKMRRTSLLLPDSLFPFSACCHIYANKVAYYSYKKTDLTGVMIENPNIYQTALSIFKLAWNFATSFNKIDQEKLKIT